MSELTLFGDITLPELMKKAGLDMALLHDPLNRVIFKVWPHEEASILMYVDAAKLSAAWMKNSFNFGHIRDGSAAARRAVAQTFEQQGYMECPLVTFALDSRADNLPAMLFGSGDGQTKFLLLYEKVATLPILVLKKDVAHFRKYQVAPPQAPQMNPAFRKKNETKLIRLLRGLPKGALVGELCKDVGPETFWPMMDYDIKGLKSIAENSAWSRLDGTARSDFILFNPLLPACSLLLAGWQMEQQFRKELC